jgi:hypothetical protein
MQATGGVLLLLGTGLDRKPQLLTFLFQAPSSVSL